MTDSTAPAPDGTDPGHHRDPSEPSAAVPGEAAAAAGAQHPPVPPYRDPGVWVVALNAGLMASYLPWFFLRNQDPARIAFIGDLAYIVFVLSLIFATWRTASAPWLPPRSRSGWRLIALAGLIYLWGNAVWFYYEVVRSISTPFPSLADLGYVLFYPPILAGIAYFLRPMENRAEQALFWLDLGVVALGAGSLVWYFLLWPIAQGEHEGLLPLVLSELYPLSATVLLVGATALMLKPWGDRSAVPIRWLVAGLLTYFVADMRYAYEMVAKVYASGGTTDALYHLAMLLITLSAVLDYRGGAHAEPTPGSIRRRARLLAVLPYLSVAAVYGLLLPLAFGWSLGSLHGTQGEGLSGLLVAAVAIAVLALVRQSVAGREIARLQTEQATRESEARFASLVRHSSDLIGLVGADRRLRYLSPAVERVLGIPAGELRERPLETLIHPDDRQGAAAFLTRVSGQTAIAARTEWRLRHANGDWRDVEILATNLIGDPTVAGVVLNGRDISERKEFERKIEEARIAAEAASRAKTEFLALISHEIRTPLNGVLGLAQVLASGSLAPEQHDMVAEIGGAGRALLAIINDILDLSNTETGRLRIEHEAFALEPLLADLDGLLGPSARGKALKFSLGRPDPALGPLLGDRRRLAQVLANLIGNAIKFTERGAVELRISEHAPAGSPPRLRFEVRDTGIGIAPATQARLFAPFTQADAGISRRFGGTGLGLALSKRLVELMDGEIGVESAPGRGSTFWFELPLPRATADGLADASARAPGAAGAGANPPAVVATPVPDGMPNASADQDLDQERLAALRQALRGNDLSALTLLTELTPQLRGAFGQTRTESLRRAVRGLRFEEALILLNRSPD